MKKNKKIFVGGLALLSAFSVCACSKDDETEGNKTITLAESWDFDYGFYPIANASVQSNYGITYWSHNFYDTLVKYNQDGEIEGCLAKDWEISSNGLEYTFNLKENIKFSDGTAIDSNAVKTSIQAAWKFLGPYYIGSYGRVNTIVDNIEVIDSDTFKLVLTQPYYGVLNDLSMTCPLAIVNPKCFNDDLSLNDEYKTKTLGSGAYMYDGNYEDNCYTFVKNPYYWGEEPEVESFKIKVIESNDAKALALRSNEIDAIVGSSRADYDSFADLKNDPNFGSSVDANASISRYIGLNLSKSPFDDVNVRKAIAYAIDKNSISNNVFNGVETSADYLFSKDKPYCNVEQTKYDYNVQIAKELLEDAGWVDTNNDGIREKDGEKLSAEFLYTKSLASVDDAMLVLESNLEAVGFEITLSGLTMIDWYTRVSAGNYEISMWATYGGAFDPNTIVTNMNPDTTSDMIAAQFSPYFDGGKALIEELDSTTNLTRVQEIYTNVLQTIANKCLAVPLTYEHELAVWNSSKINSYSYENDSQYVNVANFDLK